MFSVEDRTAARERVLELAAADGRIVAAAEVGALVHGGDRWSDLDLTFGVADGVPVGQVLADWTTQLVEQLEAVRLFDLPHGPTIYRVFLLPGLLQLDVSFTPAAEFGAGSSKFRLLYGEAVEKPFPPLPDARELLGLAVHHALRARFCVERGRLWQAEHWLSGVRDHALSLACVRRGLPARDGRGFDDLPAEVLEALDRALVRSLDRHELLRALGAAVDGLLRESAGVPELAAQVEQPLRELTTASET